VRQTHCNTLQHTATHCNTRYKHKIHEADQLTRKSKVKESLNNTHRLTQLLGLTAPGCCHYPPAPHAPPTHYYILQCWGPVCNYLDVGVLLCWCARVLVCVYTNVCMSQRMHVSVCVCMYMCVYPCAYPRMRCIYAFMFACMYASVYRGTKGRGRTRAREKWHSPVSGAKVATGAPDTLYMTV